VHFGVVLQHAGDGTLLAVAHLRALCLVVLLTCWTGRAEAAEPRFPDLRALPPSALLPTVVLIDGEEHAVLRFTAEIVNAGPGPLEIRGDSSSGQTQVVQRIFDQAGGITEAPVGTFVFHPAHHHWHFEQFAAYELWLRADYDAWLASDRQQGQPTWQGSKTTGQKLGGESFCLRDSRPSPELVVDPPSRHYRDCDATEQGLSVGWVDGYAFYLPEQWIDLGQAPLPDGDYVLRVVADPLNRLLESPDKADPDRESPAANEGVTFFSMQQGCPEGVQLALPRRLVCPDPNDPLEEDPADDGGIEAPAQIPGR
jgi:hypothetical protein